jgi:8-amino-7-oxononanoate synthase
MKLTDRWSTALDSLSEQGRYRTLRHPSGIDFTSNDYLGYAAGRIPLACDGPLRSGAASRLLCGHQPIWDEVESEIAQWHGAEAALVLTSGYAANEGLLTTVVEPGDWVASDRLNHASIIDGLRLSRAERFVYRHQDLNHLEDGLRAAARAGGRALFVVTESLFGMDGDVTPLTEVVKLAERHGAHVIVDEAHTTGCFGPDGSGCVDAAGLRERVLATVHTGGKALGVCGAYVCVPAALRELLINRCRHFIFTTALPPAVGVWWREALTRVRADQVGRSALHKAAATFRAELARHGVPAHGEHYVVPILVGEDGPAVRIAGSLQEAGWDIRAIRPPSVPGGTARLRIAVHANHEPQALIAAASAVVREVKLARAEAAGT